MTQNEVIVVNSYAWESLKKSSSKKVVLSIMLLCMIMFSINTMYGSGPSFVTNPDGTYTEIPMPPVSTDPFVLFSEVNIIQPDGVKITLETLTFEDGYISYCDVLMYSAILDTLTGYWCYAIRGEDGYLKSTGLPMHLYRGRDLDIRPGARPSDERRKEIIEKMKKEKEDRQTRNHLLFKAPWIKMGSTGTKKSLVIYAIPSDKTLTNFNDTGYFNTNDNLYPDSLTVSKLKHKKHIKLLDKKRA